MGVDIDELAKRLETQVLEDAKEVFSETAIEYACNRNTGEISCADMIWKVTGTCRDPVRIHVHDNAQRVAEAGGSKLILIDGLPCDRIPDRRWTLHGSSLNPRCQDCMTSSKSWMWQGILGLQLSASTSAASTKRTAGESPSFARNLPYTPVVTGRRLQACQWLNSHKEQYRMQ
jgi:hypothetical protein